MGTANARECTQREEAEGDSDFFVHSATELLSNLATSSYHQGTKTPNEQTARRLEPQHERDLNATGRSGEESYHEDTKGTKGRKGEEIVTADERR